MYAMDDLLQLLKAEKADALNLRPGSPPVIVRCGKPEIIEGPSITNEEAEHLLHSITTTRQRRELREREVVEFIYTLRKRTPFVVRAFLVNESVVIHVH
jgi:Tfp pilus assembly pilus retraction ATPase PilT